MNQPEGHAFINYNFSKITGLSSDCGHPKRHVYKLILTIKLTSKPQEAVKIYHWLIITPELSNIADLQKSIITNCASKWTFDEKSSEQPKHKKL